MDLTTHFHHSALATFTAYRALLNDETPVACIFVNDSGVLAYGYNDTNRSLNGTRHAEFVALDKILDEYKLSGAKVQEFFSSVTLYVTVEPCVMCALMLEQIGIKRVFFGAANDRFGGNGTTIKVQRTYESFGGILRREAIHLLRLFYIQENGTAPVPKAKKNKDVDKEFPLTLDYKKYVDIETFKEVFGEERLGLYESGSEEVTPVWGEAYKFENLISGGGVAGIPRFESLYPACPTIDDDIQRLCGLVPRDGCKRAKLASSGT